MEKWTLRFREVDRRSATGFRAFAVEVEGAPDFSQGVVSFVDAGVLTVRPLHRLVVAWRTQESPF